MAVERWTDTMLDELASSVSEMRDGMTEMQGSMTEIRESIVEIRDSIDGLRITAQALLQVAAQNQQKMNRFEEELELMKQQHAEDIQLLKQRQAENDERFNIVLEEVRYLIRGNRED